MNEDIKEILSACKEDVEKALNHQSSEYQVIRAGRANPHILDRVFIDYYGMPTPLSQMASITVHEARILAISVWDQSQVKNVVKAISMADLGVTPNDDGKVIRLVFPPLTEERRKEIVKDVKKVCEETKIAIRSSRRDALEMIKDLKNNGISEDECANAEKEVQKIIDAYCDKADELSKAKEKEIMEV